MQRIVPNLWFDRRAKEAADFYISVFGDGKINAESYYPKSAEEGLADFQKDFAGKVLTIDFELSGYRFTAINADTTFIPNPSISFFYTCDSKEEMDELWKKLSDGGKALMPLNKYPFSEYYGWVQDKFGFSWQVILNNPKGDKRPKIVPSLMFTKDKVGRAEEAMKFYTSVFKDGEISKNLNRYPAGMKPNREDMISFADFTLFGQWFAVMDSGNDDQDFSFSPAISLMVNCEDQAEIDYYWKKLSAVFESEQCGWLEDKYGVSWQIAPANIDELIKLPGAFKRMMNMKKLDIEKLKQADKK
jgi:predicted 3-demethylubiquinone-9 3-methyltransferase (glyoxalase superfamily)